MKIVGIAVISILALIGVFVGLLYAHVLPSDKLAQSSPAVGSILKAMGVYHPKLQKAQLAAAAAPATPAAPSAEQQALDAEKQQIETERADLAKQRAKQASPGVPALNVPLPTKLADIYNSMGPDDLAKIFTKQPDSEVARALTAMDERKAGKVMAALPPDRAAKIAAMLGQDTTGSNGTVASNTPTDPAVQQQVAAAPAHPLASIP